MFKDINWWTIGLWTLVSYTFGMSYFYFNSGFAYSLIDSLAIFAVAMVGHFQALRKLEIDFGVNDE
jgi:hypothetical protein